MMINIDNGLLGVLVSRLAMDYILNEIEHTDCEKVKNTGRAAVNYFWDNPALKDKEKHELDTLIGASEVENAKQGFYYGFMCAVEMIKNGDVPKQLPPPKVEI